MTAMNLKLNHRQKIAAGRRVAAKMLPYFTDAFYTLMPRPVPGLMQMVGGGMAVNAKAVMFYDPDVVENDWSVDDVAFGIAHEAGHLMRAHAKRCEENGYDKHKWNLAGDAAINDDLVLAKMTALDTDMLPKRIIYKGKPMKDGLPEEEYYAALQDGAEVGGGGGEGKGRPGGGFCGGCSGKPIEGLEGDTASTSTDGQNAGRSEVELERVRHAVAEAIQQTLKAEGAGSVPGGWAVWADGVLTPPKLRWEERVKNLVHDGVERVRGMLNYHYGRPSRRQGAIGFGRGRVVLPSLYATLPKLLAVVDTSGSMGCGNALQAAASELQGIFNAAGGEVMFGACDAKVQNEGFISVPTLQAALDLFKGGGGTDFVPVFEELKKLPADRRPHLVIMLTDGGGPAPALPPEGVNVAWVLVGSHAEVPWVADGHGERITWGEFLFTDEDAGRRAQAA